jgi:hypothetical protein
MSTTDNFKVNFTRTVTVTSAKISSVFTDEVSSASTETSYLQAVQRRHSAAPWDLELLVYVALQLKKHEVSELISCETASITHWSEFCSELKTIS